MTKLVMFNASLEKDLCEDISINSANHIAVIEPVDSRGCSSVSFYYGDSLLLMEDDTPTNTNVVTC